MECRQGPVLDAQCRGGRRAVGRLALRRDDRRLYVIDRFLDGGQDAQEAPYSRRAEEVGHRQLTSDFLLESPLCSHQMPGGGTEIEEVGVDVDVIEIQQLKPDLRHRLAELSILG